MRYFIAIGVAALLSAAGAVFVWHTHFSVGERVRQNLRSMQQSGQVAPELRGVDPNTVRLEDLDVKLTSSEMTRLDLAEFLTVFWYVLVPFCLALCVGAAFVIGKLRGRSP